MAEYPAGDRKVPPMHPGQVIAGTLDLNKVSLRTAAEAMGISAAALSNITTGKTAVGAEMALRIGAYLGNGPEVWLKLQQAFDLWKARQAIGGEVAKIRPLSDEAA